MAHWWLVHTARGRDRDKDRDRHNRKQWLPVILITSWGTGTRIHCFLLCQSNSLYHFWSHSRTVWIYHKCQSNSDDNCVFARGRATDRAKLCTWAVQKRKQAWKLRKTLVTLLQTDVDRQIITNAIRPLVSSSLKSSEDDVLLNTYYLNKPWFWSPKLILKTSLLGNLGKQTRLSAASFYLSHIRNLPHH